MVKQKKAKKGEPEGEKKPRTYIDKNGVEQLVKVRVLPPGEKPIIISLSKKAGTNFPVGKFVRMLKDGHYQSRISITSAAYLAGVIEYLVAEILETSGNICEEAGKKTLAPKHINLGMRMDEEIMKLMHSTTVMQGGCIPEINEALLPNKGKSKADGSKSKSQAPASQSQKI